MPLEKLLLIPEQSSYRYGPDNSVITTTLDGGYSKSRTDLVNNASIVSCSWLLKDYHYQYFRAFFKAATDKGVFPFLIDLILDQPYLEEYEAKFIPESVQMDTPQGLMYTVTADLEVIPIADIEFAQGIVDAYTPGGYDYLYNLEQLVNVDLEPL